MEQTQVAFNPNWKQDRRREVWRHRRWQVKSFLMGILWRFTFLTHSNRLFSRTLCRLNLYPKYTLQGRCHWCGIVHGKHWKIEKPNYGGLLSERKEEE